MPKTKSETDAADAEPQPDLVPVEFRGQKFWIPREMDEWDTEACIAIARDDFMTAAKHLLGPAQWALLRSLGTRKKDTLAFLVALGEVTRKDCVS